MRLAATSDWDHEPSAKPRCVFGSFLSRTYGFSRACRGPTSNFASKGGGPPPGFMGPRVRHRENEAATPGSFGQPRFPKALNQQLRVCLSAPPQPRGYCEGGIDLKQTSRRLRRLRVTSEMGESGHET